MRIAVIGPFDIENYGDHILKEVLEHHIKEALPSSQLDAFGVYSGRVGFRRDGAELTTVDELEAKHIQQPYDALIVAGGSVIHYKTLLQNIDEKKVEYPIWKLWTQASRVASKHGTRLIWNSPEAPFGFQGWQKLVTKPFLDAVHYISVRSAASFHALVEHSPAKPVIIPDSAWLLRDAYSDELLRSSVPSEVASEDMFVIFHCNQRLQESDIPRIVALLLSVQAKGYKVLLMPLAYTNNEQSMLELINKEANGAFIYMDRTLTLAESVALFSRCLLYIGLSFHGAITTSVFGGDIIAFDYENRNKTEELYEVIGKKHQYTTTIDELEGVVTKRLSKPLSHSPISPRVLKLQARVRTHFKDVSSVLKEPPKAPSQNIDMLYDVTAFETKRSFDKAQELQALSNNYQQCYSQFQTLLASVNSSSN